MRVWLNSSYVMIQWDEKIRREKREGIQGYIRHLLALRPPTQRNAQGTTQECARMDAGNAGDAEDALHETRMTSRIGMHLSFS